MTTLQPEPAFGPEGLALVFRRLELSAPEAPSSFPSALCSSRMVGCAYLSLQKLEV